VVVDLRAVRHIDARGVGVLAVLIAHAKSADRRLVLARSSDRVERILRLTRLDVELHNDSVRDRSARPAEADEDRGVLEQVVVRNHLGLVRPQTAPKERAYDGRADCMA
jgi:hypothetical protein